MQFINCQSKHTGRLLGLFCIYCVSRDTTKMFGWDTPRPQENGRGGYASRGLDGKPHTMRHFLWPMESLTLDETAREGFCGDTCSVRQPLHRSLPKSIVTLGKCCPLLRGNIHQRRETFLIDTTEGARFYWHQVGGAQRCY